MNAKLKKKKKKIAALELNMYPVEVKRTKKKLIDKASLDSAFFLK